jgi:hypothetical protein
MARHKKLATGIQSESEIGFSVRLFLQKPNGQERCAEGVPKGLTRESITPIDRVCETCRPQ